MNYGGISIPLSVNLPFGSNKDSYSGIEISFGGFADYAVGESIPDNNGNSLSFDFKSEAEKCIKF